MNLQELKTKAMAAVPLKLTQEVECFTNPEMEYMIAVSNPATILDLIQTVEEMREALDWVLKADVTEGDLKGDVSKALTKLKEKWGI